MTITLPRPSLPSRAARWLQRLVVAPLAGLLVSCGGDSGTVAAPQIASFTATSNAIPNGASTTLTGSFSNGTGVVTPGNLAVTSGVGIAVTSTGTQTYTLTVTNAAGVSVTATRQVVVSGGFGATGALATARTHHTATLLQNGQVLIARGRDVASNIAMANAELFDATSGTFSAAGTPTAGGYGGAAVRLNDGTVLIPSSGESEDLGNWTFAPSQTYAPSTNTFAASGAMVTQRVLYSATLLADGRVLVAGGNASANGAPDLASAEVYDPATGHYMAVGDMGVGRSNQSATLLASGQVLIAGGGPGSAGVATAPTAELFDPATGVFASTGAMATAQSGHTATRLADGSVLVVGGSGLDATVLATSELYR